MYSIGRGCNGISYAFLQHRYNRGFTLSGGCLQNSFCRFGKISSGFCNQAFLQYGCKRVFTSFRGCVQSSFCRFGKISSGFCNHASLSKWGKKGINSVRCATWLVGGPSSPLWGSITGLHRLS